MSAPKSVPQSEGHMALIRSSAGLCHFDAQMLLIAATRYFIGRMTIETCHFAEKLSVAWAEIPEDTRQIIRRDLNDAFRRDDFARQTGNHGLGMPLGMDCDREAWEKVRAKWHNVEISKPPA